MFSGTVIRRAAATVIAVAGAVALYMPGAASAHTGEFAKFNFCPSTTPGVLKCLDSVTNSGSIVLGNKTTPIVNPVTLQGGFSEPNEENISSFFAATNGVTLSKTPQPVPGGIAGIVPPESAPFLVKLALALIFENGLTGVNATLELAEPASQIKLSSYHLLVEEEVALKLPVKIHLENPLLGSSCYVGSDSAPIIWNLTTGATAPPGPNTSIAGKAGFTTLKESNEIAEITENTLVDNAWAAPEANGCGEGLSALIDPIIDATVGLPAAAGKNSATLNNTLTIASVGSVNSH